MTRTNVRTTGSRVRGRPARRYCYYLATGNPAKRPSFMATTKTAFRLSRPLDALARPPRSDPRLARAREETTSVQRLSSRARARLLFFNALRPPRYIFARSACGEAVDDTVKTKSRDPCTVIAKRSNARATMLSFKRSARFYGLLRHSHGSTTYPRIIFNTRHASVDDITYGLRSSARRVRTSSTGSAYCIPRETNNVRTE